MAEPKSVYKCNVCGNIVEVLHAGIGNLVCCGEAMELLTEKSTDAGLEKHVPVIEAADGVINVKVGSVPHPMEEHHFIEWIEVITDNGNCRQYLTPGSEPAAEFDVEGEKLTTREYCSVHGLWKSA